MVEDRLYDIESRSAKQEQTAHTVGTVQQYENRSHHAVNQEVRSVPTGSVVIVCMFRQTASGVLVARLVPNVGSHFKTRARPNGCGLRRGGLAFEHSQQVVVGDRFRAVHNVR